MGVNNFYFKLFGSIASLNLPPECIRKRIKDNNFGVAVICCLVIVRRSIFVVFYSLIDLLGRSSARVTGKAGENTEVKLR